MRCSNSFIVGAVGNTEKMAILLEARFEMGGYDLLQVKTRAAAQCLSWCSAIRGQHEAPTGRSWRFGRQWRRRHSRKLRHGIERPIGNLQFFQNELLQVGIGFPAASPVSLEDHAGNAIDDRFGNRPRDLSRQRPEILASFRAERNRSVPVVVNPVSRINLPVFPILGRDAILLGLRKVVPYRRPIHRSYCSIIGYKGNVKSLPLFACSRLHWIINRSLRGETVRTPDDGAPAFIASRTASPMNFCTVFFIGRAPSAL